MKFSHHGFRHPHFHESPMTGLQPAIHLEKELAHTIPGICFEEGLQAEWVIIEPEAPYRFSHLYQQPNSQQPHSALQHGGGHTFRWTAVHAEHWEQRKQRFKRVFAAHA